VSADLLAMYREATGEVFRLEAQREYAVPAESAQLQAFREGRPLPSDPAVERSMEIVRTATARGARIYRAHIVDLPLGLYLRYEMAAYAENIAAGEQVNIAVRAWHQDLECLRDDFVLFKPPAGGAAVVWMDYDTAGHLTGTRYSNDPADVARARRARDIVMAHAVPLHRFASLAEAV
jgi:hypothetical protein